MHMSSLFSLSCSFAHVLRMATAQEVAESAQALILKHFTHWDAETWLESVHEASGLVAEFSWKHE